MKNKMAIKKTALNIISKITGINISHLKNRVLFREELNIDSLKEMEIIANCEYLLKIKYDQNDLAELRTIGSFLNLTCRIIADKKRK